MSTASSPRGSTRVGGRPAPLVQMVPNNHGLPLQAAPESCLPQPAKMLWCQKHSSAERRKWTMTKGELIAHIAQQYPHYTPQAVETVLNAVLEQFATTLTQGERVELRGFGSFVVRER